MGKDRTAKAHLSCLPWGGAESKEVKKKNPMAMCHANKNAAIWDCREWGEGEE